MPFCPRCGLEGTRECTHCGTPIPSFETDLPSRRPESAPENAPTNVAPESGPSGGAVQNPRANRRALLVWGAIGFLAVIALLWTSHVREVSRANAELATAKAQQAAVARHEREARENQLRREAWQKAHPAEYAAQKARAREIAARKAAEVAREADRQRVADAKMEKERVIAQARQEKEAHPCDAAISALNDMSDNDSSQVKYDKAVSGLHYAELCDVELPRTITMGKLLGWKAVAEHNLSSGDSAVDINQAITLLAKCQALPGAYGEKIGANCEAEEETLIKYKMKWDMARY